MEGTGCLKSLNSSFLNISIKGKCSNRSPKVLESGPKFNLKQSGEDTAYIVGIIVAFVVFGIIGIACHQC